VQGSLRDLVDVVGVEIAELLEQGSFLGRGERVVEGEDLLLPRLAVLGLELGQLLL